MSMKQQSMTDIEYSNRKRQTKRDEFLELMNTLIPWDEWCEVVVPYYPGGKRGRPTRGIETMLRMYLLATWFNLSDEGVEDAIYDSYAFRNFMQIDFMGEEQTPDATTLCKFRKLLNEHGVTQLFFDTIQNFMKKHGRIMQGGTIVDATIIDAPTSTKNKEKQRDPEMHQVKKGNEWYFGARLHVGVDAGTGHIHSVEMTAANKSERDVVPNLLRSDDEVMYGDAGYTGMTKRDEIKQDEHLSGIDYRTNTRNRLHNKSKAPNFDWDKYIEYQKSRVRSKVEYVFFIIKRIFHYNKVRYRGIAKNKTHALTLCALANLFMIGQAGRTWALGV